jgi:hypothetical protein
MFLMDIGVTNSVQQATSWFSDLGISFLNVFVRYFYGAKQNGLTSKETKG